MQELIKYKGYSIFCYCEPSFTTNKYLVSLVIQDIENKKPAKHVTKLDKEFLDIEVALGYAVAEGKRYIDANESGIKHSDMKGSIE
jgi:hypothetical protein